MRNQSNGVQTRKSSVVTIDAPGPSDTIRTPRDGVLPNDVAVPIVHSSATTKTTASVRLPFVLRESITSANDDVDRGAGHVRSG